MGYISFKEGQFDLQPKAVSFGQREISVEFRWVLAKIHTLLDTMQFPDAQCMVYLLITYIYPQNYPNVGK